MEHRAVERIDVAGLEAGEDAVAAAPFVEGLGEAFVKEFGEGCAEIIANAANCVVEAGIFPGEIVIEDQRQIRDEVVAAALEELLGETGCPVGAEQIGAVAGYCVNGVAGFSAERRGEVGGDAIEIFFDGLFVEQVEDGFVGAGCGVCRPGRVFMPDAYVKSVAVAVVDIEGD